MKKIIAILLSLLLPILVFAQVQTTSNFWKYLNGFLSPSLSSWGINVSTTTATSTFAGGLQAKDGYFWNTLQANNISATSSTATSTFAGAVGIGTTTPFKPFSFEGTSALIKGKVSLPESSGNGNLEIISSDGKGDWSVSSINSNGNLTLYNVTYNKNRLTVSSSTDFINTSHLSIASSDAISNLFRFNEGAFIVGSNTTGSGVERFIFTGIRNDSQYETGITAWSANGTSSDRYLSFTTNLNEHMRITSTGNIGIGTTSPYAKLSVVGETVASHFTATTSTASTFPYASTTALTVSGTAYFPSGIWNSSGNVGIGTTTPNATLTLSNDTSAELAITENVDSTSAGQLTFRKQRGTGAVPAAAAVNDYSGFISFQARGTTGNMTEGASIYSQVEAIGGSSYSNLLFNTRDQTSTAITERMRIANNGNVGIGTTSPSGKLSVDIGADAANGIVLGKVSNADRSARLFFVDSTNSHAIYNSAGSLLFTYGAIPGSMSGTNAMVINNIGNVMVGASSPNTNLHVRGANDTGNVGLRLTNASTNALASTSIFFGITTNEAFNGGEIRAIRSPSNDLQIYNNGNFTATFNGSNNVGIGTTSPSQKLSVQGNVLADAYLEYSPIFVGDALSAIKNIKAEANTTKGEWASVDHESLPVGVKYEEDIVKQVQVGTTTKIIPSEEKVNEETGEIEVIPSKEEEVPVMATTTEHFVGRNLGNTVQLALAGVKQLIGRVDLAFTEIAQLFSRMLTAETRINELEARIVELEKLLPPE